MNTEERTPSRNGIGPGLHIGPRPEKKVDQTGITTQKPNTPAPKRGGYA